MKPSYVTVFGGSPPLSLNVGFPAMEIKFIESSSEDPHEGTTLVKEYSYISLPPNF